MPLNDRQEIEVKEHFYKLWSSIKTMASNPAKRYKPLRENPLLDTSKMEITFLRMVLLMPDFFNNFDGFQGLVQSQKDGMNFLMKCFREYAHVLKHEDFKWLLNTYDTLGILNRALCDTVSKNTEPKHDEVQDRPVNFCGASTLMLACNSKSVSARLLKLLVNAHDRALPTIGNNPWTTRLFDPSMQSKNIMMITLSNEALQVDKLKVLLESCANRIVLRQLLEQRETSASGEAEGRHALMCAVYSEVSLECLCLLIASHESCIMFQKAFNVNWGTEKKHHKIGDIVNMLGTQDAISELIRLGAEKCYKKSIRYWRDFDPQFQFPINDRVYKRQSLVGTSDLKGSYKNEDDDKSSCVLQ